MKSKAIYYHIIGLLGIILTFVGLSAILSHSVYLTVFLVGILLLIVASALEVQYQKPIRKR